MSLRCLVTFGAATGKDPAIYELKTLPDLLKVHQEGLSRSPFWFEEDDAELVARGIASKILPLAGPFTATHAIRRAADLLLDECACDGMSIQLESAGKRLPELPARPELEALLRDERTLILVDGKPYKPSGEVLGFQNVYDDTVRFIDGLKKLGVPQDAMFMTATPEEITVEVHPDVFGAPTEPSLPERYRQLLITLGGIRAGAGRLVRTTDRTLLLTTATFGVPLLVPGAVHPALHRPKVGVGASHFAYGTAAFSDFCGKKRTLDECVREVRTWLKFLEAKPALVPAAKQALESARGGAAAAGAVPTPATPAATAVPAGAGGGFAAGLEAGLGIESRAPAPAGRRPDEFRPFRAEAAERAGKIGAADETVLPTPWTELNRHLGGGWQQNRLHLIVGGREEGKAAFLLQQAMHLSTKYGVLYISSEHTADELMVRVAAWLGRIPAGELAARAALRGPEGDAARPKLKNLYEAVANAVRDGLYLRGSDSAIPPFDADALAELMKMVPAAAGRVLIVESLRSEDLGRVLPFLSRLRQIAADQGFTVLASLHLAAGAFPRPHFVDGPDVELLERWQAGTDSLLHLTSERVNLRKFLAMSQGKVDPAVADSLEKRLYQAATGTRQRNDTFSLLRLLHTRAGNRAAVLFLYQRDLMRSWEGPSIPLGRP
ncbi:MAG TPA: DnaB-like helicase C-terminal domain-containing protein [Candidatus Ozemobacteraceae bacterium]|nr:DnaB-like helicase C-terminal domain-containing protein [Candidatus Ozemobacteraceae bacterium]